MRRVLGMSSTRRAASGKTRLSSAMGAPRSGDMTLETTDYHAASSTLSVIYWFLARLRGEFIASRQALIDVNHEGGGKYRRE